MQQYSACYHVSSSVYQHTQIALVLDDNLIIVDSSICSQHLQDGILTIHSNKGCLAPHQSICTHCSVVAAENAHGVALLRPHQGQARTQLQKTYACTSVMDQLSEWALVDSLMLSGLQAY